MAKTNPIGVRFDEDLLKSLEEDKLATSPQKALNFLTEFYRNRRDKVDLGGIITASKLFEGAKPLAGVEAEVLDKTFKRLASKTPTRLRIDDPDEKENKSELILQYENELKTLGTGQFANTRKKFLEKQILKLKTH